MGGRLSWQCMPRRLVPETAGRRKNPDRTWADGKRSGAARRHAILRLAV